MVRVAGLKQQIDAGVIDPSADGATPAEQLAAIRKAATRLMAESRACLQEQLMPALDQAGIHILDYAALTDAQKSQGRRVFRSGGVSGAHAAGRRSGAALPAHLEPQPQPGRDDPRPQGAGAFCAHQSARYAAALHAHQALVGQRAQRRHRAVSSLFCVAGAADRRASQPAVPRHGSRGGASLPRGARRRHRYSGTGGVRSAGKHGRKRAAAAVWHGGAGVHQPRHARAHPRDSDRESRNGSQRSVSHRRAAGPEQPDEPVRHRSVRVEGNALRAGHAGPAARQELQQRSVRRDPAAGYSAAPSLRFIRAGGGLSQDGGARSRCAGHQADVVSRGAQLAGGRGAAGGQPERQAGGRAGGTEGALRRGKQHRLGQGAGSGRRARGLRPAGPEDAFQDRAGGAQRRRRHPPLRAPLDRQLQRRHRAALHRHGLLHRR